MCGIAGKLNFNSEPVDQSLIHQMCNRIVHRGPDDSGVYFDGPVGLGVRRLSIIDLEGGHQPISNEDESIWIVYNGETYNFPELRVELEAKGHSFRTNTDTEVIVHLYEEMGEMCVTRLNGMFAFALWDGRRRRMVLARDRLGQKPLHYAITKNGLLFASEISSLLEDPAVDREVNLVALDQYLRVGYVPGPLTMLNGIMKLPPAHLLVWDQGQIRFQRYWQLDFSQKRNLSIAEWSEQILEVLRDAVRIRLISDVPLGALLSGGIDSSLVVAMMSQLNAAPIKTFSIGFDDDRYNELPYARQVAQHLNTEHHEEIVRPDAVALLPKLIQHYGEPFGDESCIPTYYVSKVARQHVTVALSGDGGDESFGGYPRVAQFMNFSPVHSLRGLVAGEIKSIGSSRRILSEAFNRSRWYAFAHELSYRLKEIQDPMRRYAQLWIVWKEANRDLFSRDVNAILDGNNGFAPMASVWEKTRGWDSVDRLLYLDMMTYLPYDLQVKMDIASMAVSLEVRSPFLDYRLVELAATMPAEHKIKNGQTKVLLRRLIEPFVPQTIPHRKKMGFSVPIAHWLSTDLRPMMEDLLLDESSRNRGIFKPDILQKMVKDHRSGQQDYSRNLWLLLTFELWYRSFIERFTPLPQ